MWDVRKSAMLNTHMSFSRILVFIAGLALFLTSSVWSSKVSQDLTKWPDNLSEVLLFQHTENNRFGLNDSWSGNIISNSKIETKTTNQSSSVSMVSKKFVIESLSGENLFSLEQSFYVDRYTRHDLPGGTDPDGVAYTAFPHHTGKKEYLVWPGTFGSAINLRFIDQQIIKGLHVYHFQSQANVDDTAGYVFLPLVPEKYRVKSQATVDMYIEPVTGILVNYSDKGISYYSNDKIDRIWDISQWSNKFTDNAISAQVKIAKNKMNYLSLHENIIPLLFFASGLSLIFFSVLTKRKR